MAGAAQVIDRIARRAVAWWCRRQARQSLQLRVEGGELVPSSGALLIVCRHYHHTHDGVALIAALPRFVRIVVALDWTPNRAVQLAMERACALLGWPWIVRPGLKGRRTAEAHERRLAAVNGRGMREVVRALWAGDVVAIFPEAYPNVDPVYTPKQGNEMIAFRDGFARVAAIASRRSPVALIPAGLEYRDEHVTLRFGSPRYARPEMDIDSLVSDIEREVRHLSAMPADESVSAGA